MKKEQRNEKDLCVVNTAFEALKERKEFFSRDLRKEIEDATRKGGRKTNPALTANLVDRFEKEFASVIAATIIGRRGRGVVKSYTFTKSPAETAEKVVIATEAPKKAPVTVAEAGNQFKATLQAAERIFASMDKAGHREVVLADLGVDRQRFADLMRQLKTLGVDIPWRGYFSNGRNVIHVDNPRLAVSACQKKLDELFGVEPKAEKKVSFTKLSATKPKAKYLYKHEEAKAERAAKAAITAQERYQIYQIALDLRRHAKVSIHEITRYAQQVLLMDTTSTAVLALLKKSELFVFNGEHVSLNASDEKILEFFDPKASRRTFYAYLKMSFTEVQQYLGKDVEVTQEAVPCPGVDGIYKITINRTRDTFRRVLRLYEILRPGEKFLDEVLNKQLKVVYVREHAEVLDRDTIYSAEKSFFSE